MKTMLRALIALSVGTWAGGIEAQEPASRATLEGVLLDAANGTPLINARLRIDASRRGTLTDASGRFTFVDVPRGIWLITAEHYGYESVEAEVAVSEESVSIELGLNPLPVMLDGLAVVSDRLAAAERRLESRRRAVATTVRAYDLARLTRSGTGDVLEFLRYEASLGVHPCGGGRLLQGCVWRRGRVIMPRVCIDDNPVPGGMDVLGTYRPQDLYLIEVVSQGVEIRAYTHQFMERMARRETVLVPIGVGAC